VVEGIKRDDKAAREDGGSHVAGSEDEGDVLVGSEKGRELHAHAAHVGLGREGGREGGDES